MPISISSLISGLKAWDHKTVAAPTAPGGGGGGGAITIMKPRPEQAGQGLQAWSCIHWTIFYVTDLPAKGQPLWLLDTSHGELCHPSEPCPWALRTQLSLSEVTCLGWPDEEQPRLGKTQRWPGLGLWNHSLVCAYLKSHVWWFERKWPL